MKKCLCLISFLTLHLAISQANAAEKIVFPRHEAIRDPQLEYVLSVLRLAIQKSNKPYTLTQSDTVMGQRRAFAELAKPGGVIDIVWAMTDVQREQHFLPIRIPIDKGLIGWRLALVKEVNVKRWNGLKTVEMLAPYVAGQVPAWPDTAILTDNGLKVALNESYEGLFRQVANGRIDYYPRSVIEIDKELKSHKDLRLAIDPYIIIRYPAAFYFFVNLERAALAEDLNRGLEMALRDGSFNRLFHRHFGETLKQLRIPERVMIDLKNPYLPPKTPIHRKELWYSIRN